MKIKIIIGVIVSVVCGYLNSQSLNSDAVAGIRVFEKSRCNTCHVLFSEQKNIGPGLNAQKMKGNFFDLLALVWNHAPRMKQQMKSHHLSWPSLTETKLNQLFSMLYLIPYLGKPGNVDRGKKILRHKGCLKCHALGSMGNIKGIPLDTLGQSTGQVILLQRMWNHGGVMLSQIIASGIPVPQMSGSDFNDILSAINGSGNFVSGRSFSLNMGDPQKGSVLVRDKKCLQCHSIKKEGKNVGPPLDKVAENRTLSETMSRLWNHVFMMQTVFREKKLEWPYFTEKEMADLLIYLYSLNYQIRLGNSSQGKKIFTGKKCQSCHFKSPENKQQYLEKVLGKDPIQFAVQIWNHIPYISSRMVATGREWPRLTGDELQHIYTFLQSLSGKQKTEPQPPQ